jgi:hypothetical protein
MIWLKCASAGKLCAWLILLALVTVPLAAFPAGSAKGTQKAEAGVAAAKAEDEPSLSLSEILTAMEALEVAERRLRLLLADEKRFRVLAAEILTRAHVGSALSVRFGRQLVTILYIQCRYACSSRAPLRLRRSDLRAAPDARLLRANYDACVMDSVRKRMVHEVSLVTLDKGGRPADVMLRLIDVHLVTLGNDAMVLRGIERLDRAKS